METLIFYRRPDYGSAVDTSSTIGSSRGGIEISLWVVPVKVGGVFTADVLFHLIDDEILFSQEGIYQIRDGDYAAEFSIMEYRNMPQVFAAHKPCAVLNGFGIVYIYHFFGHEIINREIQRAYIIVPV